MQSSNLHRAAGVEPSNWRKLLHEGTVIPAHPLALTEDLQLDRQYQRALTRYYCAAGAGGVAVGVHTTQFEIHDPATDLLRTVLQLAAETTDEYLRSHPRPFVKVAGILGRTEQAVAEARLARDLGYHAGLLSLAAFADADDDTLLDHTKAVANELPVIGFYLQPAVGGRILSYAFWRRFVEIENIVAIKIAPFNRYQTIDVVRAVANAGRQGDIALYTGNDDNIVADLITDYDLGSSRPHYFVGGLLGQWAVWTKTMVDMLATIQQERAADAIDYEHWLRYGVHLTDANSAIFDVENQFRGSISGIHRILQRQGLMQGTWTLSPHDRLYPEQAAEIERVCTAYPHLTDDAFVAAHLEEWLA